MDNQTGWVVNGERLNRTMKLISLERMKLEILLFAMDSFKDYEKKAFDLVNEEHIFPELKKINDMIEEVENG